MQKLQTVITINSSSSIAVIEMRGDIVMADIKKAIGDLLAHPDHVDGMAELWDFRGATVAAFSAGDLQLLAGFVKNHLSQLAKRTAIVVAADVDYGVGRMWEVYAEEAAPQERRLFRNHEAALDWLSLSSR